MIAILDEACRFVDVANHGHEDWIPLSLLQCGDWYFSPMPFIFHQEPNFNVVLDEQSTKPWHCSLYGNVILLRHNILGIYGAKMMSFPGRWDIWGWDNISTDVQIWSTYLSPLGENCILLMSWYRIENILCVVCCTCILQYCKHFLLSI